MPDESEPQRVNRELIELLNELRIVLPGVQVLFAFLLAVPFQQRFGSVTTFQRDVYFAALFAALLASAFLIAPSAYHRLNFHSPRKAAIIAISNRLAIVGIVLLAAAMVAVIVLIADVLFGTAMTIASGTASAAVFALMWGVLPLRQRHRQT